MELGDIPALKSLSVQIGSIFKLTLYPSDGVTPKNHGESSRDKYVVVLGIDDDRVMLASVLINSSINLNFVHSIAPFQREIHKADYPFMTKPVSYVDCYKLRELTVERLINDAVYIGHMVEEDLKSIVALSVKSPVNSVYILKKYHIEE